MKTLSLLEQPGFKEKAKQIKLMVFDVDGVLTDGRIYVDDNHVEIKAFHVLDGIGIKHLQHAHIQIAVISGRKGEGVNHRLKTLGVENIFLGIEDKKSVLLRLLEKYDYTPEQTAYMGDDLPDLPLLTFVGLGVTVPNAVQEIIDMTPFITQKKGGKGAVRELSDAILKSQDQWDGVIQYYRSLK